MKCDLNIQNLKMLRLRRSTIPPVLPKGRLIVEEARQPKMKKVNQYLLTSKLGTGSSSKVYLSIDEDNGKYYAAKAVHVLERRHNGQGASSLEREIRIMRQMNHPNIVKLYDVLYASRYDIAYLFMEWADCGTLQDAINKPHRFDEISLASIFKQIIYGLSYLHSKGIVHKDIKPSNILLFSYGAAKLSDFGIGHSFQSAEAVVGSPAYQAPELFDGSKDDDNISNFEEEDVEEIDPTKGDIWSLGISLFEAAYGYLPFIGENMYEIVHQIYTTELSIPQNNEYSPLLADLITKLLTVDQAKRPTLDEVLNHDFFKQAVDAPNFQLQKHQPPAVLPDVKIVKVEATICHENFSFISEMRSFSCPGNFEEVRPSIPFAKVPSLCSSDQF